jgi:hypothetical protein
LTFADKHANSKEMDTPHPRVLGSVARKWHEVPMSELVNIFHSAFAPAHALPDAAVADAARDYAEFCNAAVSVSLVCENLNWSVYVVMCEGFGARWVAVPTSYGAAIDLDAVDREEARALNIPGLEVICGFPVPPRGWR